ncbi:hypothetical protein C8Q72DRAFT_291616 [Fomitopsis betulina]|nr:hypothetical protein C8Q72DRAFT_291616 [Fomitopsis betulina]
MAASVLRGPSWRSFYSARSALEALTASLRPTLAASKTYFSLSPETPTMQAMRKMEYPDTPADSSIFEEPVDLSHIPEAQHTISLTADLPAHLIAEGNFEEAFRVLDEMRRMHLHPRPSQVFVEAALHAYHVAKLAGVQQHCSTFRLLYLLIPPASKSGGLTYSQSRKVLDVLLGSPVLDLPLVEWYIRINVSKGYFIRDYAAIVSDFVRLSNQHSIIRLLDAIYYRSRRLPDRLARLPSKQTSHRESDARFLARRNYRRNQMLRAVYSEVIDRLCRSGRAQEAAIVLQAARRRSIPVSTSVLSRLDPKLETILDAGSVSLVKQLLQAWPANSQHTHGQVESATPSLDLRDLHEPTQLARAIRVLRQHVHASTCPIPSELVHVIDACIRAGRIPLLTLLRKKAYRTTSSAMKWALAEMLFYSKQRDAPALSIVFANSFRMVGVPLQSLHHAWFLRVGLPPTKFPLPKSPLQGLAMSSLPHVKHKIWPSAYHTAMVWHACVKETKRGGAVKKLYYELLAQVVAAREAERSEPEHASSGPTQRHGTSLSSAKQTTMGPRGPSWMYRDAHFNIFIKALGKRSPAAASRVVSDMYRLGIKPSEESMIVLLRCFAVHNKHDMLLDLLTRMEATFTQQHSCNSDSNIATTDKPVASDLVLPAPNVAAYLVVIENLIKNDRSETALQVAMRMLKNLSYRSGADTAADQVLRELVLLLSDPGREDPQDGAAARLEEAIHLANTDGTATAATDPSPQV